MRKLKKNMKKICLNACDKLVIKLIDVAKQTDRQPLHQTDQTDKTTIQSIGVTMEWSDPILLYGLRLLFFNKHMSKLMIKEN